jgi:hypothetical protein
VAKRPRIAHHDAVGGQSLLGRHSHWVYLLPSLHLGVCLFAFVGFVIPGLQFLGILFTFIVFADLPISLPYYALGWKYGDLAVSWILVAGTLWWYVLGRAAIDLRERFRG